MKKLLLTLLKVPSAFVLGCVVAFSLMQNDPWLKKRIERFMISSISDLIGELFTVQVTDIDLLRGELVMRGASAISSVGDWSFAAPIMRMKVSWFSWHRGKGFDTDLILERPTMTTRYRNGVYAAEKPINAIMNAPLVVPLFMHRCRTEDGLLTIQAPHGKTNTRFTSVSTVRPHSVVTRMRCNEGKAYHKGELFAQRAHGHVMIEAHQDQPYSTVTMKLVCTRPVGRSSFRNSPYHLYYRSARNRGMCRWRTEDGLFALQADGITSTDDELVGSVSFIGDLGEIASYVIGDQACDITGIGTFDGTVGITDDGYSYKGKATLDTACCEGVVVDDAALELAGTDKEVSAMVQKAQSLGMHIKGSLSGTFATQNASGDLELTKPYTALPHCVITTGRAQVGYKNSHLQADLSGEGNFFEGGTVPLRGRVKTDLKTATVKGTFGGSPLDCELTLKPLSLKTLTVKDQLRTPRLTLDQHTQGVQGSIDEVLIKTILEAITGHQLSGSLQAAITTQSTKQGTRLKLKVEDASLKIPGTYTVIKEVSAILDLLPDERCVIIKDLRVCFHKGSAWSSQGIFCFAQDGSLVSAQVPLQCKELLISKHKELFGTLSGGMTALYKEGRWRLEGLITLENAHAQSNLLSTEVQRSLIGAPVRSPFAQTVDLALRVQSRMPIKVNTSFLTADAHLDMVIGGTLESPTLSGSVDLAHGVLDFPYKPLFVTSGKLVVAPGQPDGPTIQLTAKNKIRTYTVMMRVTGSLAQPNITFESTPQLSEEGIMTLLLAGSDQGSLTAAMPRMVMQQVEDLLFGSEETLSAAQQIMKGLLTPLKNVRLIKKDDDQDELQAVLEVDINDRLRAKAQNNLQLSDETQLELEYAVSDEVRVKAVRDQKGSLGGEVEMRWKF